MRAARIWTATVLLVAVVTGPAIAGQYIEGYTSFKSYLPGDTLRFHVSSTSPVFDITIFRDEWTWRLMGTASGIAGHYYPVPAEHPWEGAGWPVAYSWKIPAGWLTGSYIVRFRTQDGSDAYAPFCLRPALPGSRSRLLFLMNYNTRNAYNSWGLKSLYISDVVGDSSHAVKVSFQRPFVEEGGKGRGWSHQWAICSDLEAEGFAPEYLTEWDIDRDPALLSHYDVLVLANHHEYISRPLYNAILAHHARGGHIASFSANPLWWQVRYEESGNLMVGYRDYALEDDPLYGIQDSLVTTLWGSALLGRPCEALMGVVYQPYSYYFEPEDYTVQSASHWIFQGIDVHNGGTFGWKLAAGETDWTGLHSPHVDMLMTAHRDTPLPGYVPRTQYANAASTYYEDSPAYGFPAGNGGEVFAAGTHTGWSSGLLTSSPGYLDVRHATRNIILHMLNHPPPRTGVASGPALAPPGSPVLYPSEPNPFRVMTTIRFAVPHPGRVRLAIYDLAGRQVRLLADDSWRECGSASVNWDGLDELGREAGAGVYFCRLTAEGGEATRRVVRLR